MSGTWTHAGRPPRKCLAGSSAGPLLVRTGGWISHGGRASVRPQAAADSGTTIDTSPGHVCRTPAVLMAVVPGATDGQSAGGSPASGSGSLQLSRPALRAAACGGRPRPAETRLPYRPSGRFWLLSQSIGKVNLKELPHRWQAARDCFSGQMPSVGRQTLILRRNGRRLGPLPL